MPISGPLAEVASTWPRGIDHIGERRLADLGVAKKSERNAEIDIGDRDAGVEAGMRHRDRHEGAVGPRRTAGEKLTPRATVSVKRMSREKSALLLIVTVVRDSRSISRPLAVEQQELADGGDLLSSCA